jgi:hypothetical protein
MGAERRPPKCPDPPGCLGWVVRPWPVISTQWHFWERESIGCQVQRCVARMVQDGEDEGEVGRKKGKGHLGLMWSVPWGVCPLGGTWQLTACLGVTSDQGAGWHVHTCSGRTPQHPALPPISLGVSSARWQTILGPGEPWSPSCIS